MTREMAKKNLIACGIDEPSDEQISKYLDQVNGETKKEKDKADKYKEKAEKVDELQSKVDELESQGLTDAEKANKALEDAQAEIAQLKANGFKSEAKAILKGAGLDDETIEGLMPGMVADTLENTQARANAYVSAMNKFRDDAIKQHDKDSIDDTHTPGGNGGSNDDKEKTAAEKMAEGIGKVLSGTNKESADILSAYK